MMFQSEYAATEPSRDEIDALGGAVLVEFGAPWCPFCQAIQPQLSELFTEFPTVAHYKIEDGKGKPLGRSFRVKLWPNLVFMHNGKIVEQLARPNHAEIRRGFERIGRSV